MTELEVGRACKAMSGWDELWLWRTCICWALVIPCCPLSTWPGGASKGCWDGAEAAGRWGGLIFSAISCSLILLIKTRLSSWQPGNNICDKRTDTVSSVSVSSSHHGSLYWLTWETVTNTVWHDPVSSYTCYRRFINFRSIHDWRISNFGCITAIYWAVGMGITELRNLRKD